MNDPRTVQVAAGGDHSLAVDAASVAAPILTTDAMVAELPKEDKGMAGGMPGGGIGGMGDMDM